MTVLFMGAMAFAPRLPAAEAAEVLEKSRFYGAGKVALRIDGLDAGAIREVAGGSPYAEVVSEPPGPDHIVRKHIGNVKYEDLKIDAGLGMSRGFWTWLQDMMDGRPVRHNGEVAELDLNYKEVFVTSFQNALLTEIGFPTLDVSLKEPGELSIKLTPESTQRRKGSAQANPSSMAKQKQWLVSNFRLVLGDLPTQRVSKIDAFTVKQALGDSNVGEFRNPVKAPTGLQLSNLVITVPLSEAGPYYDWLDDFVVRGNSGAANERAGTLQMLGPDMKQVLFEVGFEGVGISRITREPVGAGKEGVAQVRVELYVERAKLSTPGN
jgi:hypothetical protein